MPYKDTSADWFFLAQSDLTAAERLYEEKLYHLVCFHAHQAIEKTLKGMLLRAQLSIAKSHDLSMLLKKAQKAALTRLPSEQDVVFVNRFYIPTRYPDTFPGALPEGLPQEDDAHRALTIAHAFIREKDKRIEM